MTVTADRFRTDFPAFADTTRYPDENVSAWLSIAGLMLNTGRWDTTPGADGRSMLDLGTELFVCHNLGLDLQADQRARLGGPPGAQVGVLGSVATGGATVSYDTQVGIDQTDGHWNLTAHGLRFIRLCKMIGSGPVILGVGIAPPFTIPGTVGGAFAGPWVYNIPNPSNSG